MAGVDYCERCLEKKYKVGVTGPGENEVMLLVNVSRNPEEKDSLVVLCPPCRTEWWEFVAYQISERKEWMKL